MKLQTISVLLFVLVSCQAKNQTSSSISYKDNSVGSLKEMYRVSIDNPYNTGARAYYVRKHKDEVLKTMEVVEQTEVQKDIFYIFYRYSIGTETVKKTTIMRRVDGLFMEYYKYFSSYNADPFDNGKGEEGKAFLKKVDDWDNSDNIWWAY